MRQYNLPPTAPNPKRPSNYKHYAPIDPQAMAERRQAAEQKIQQINQALQNNPSPLDEEELLRQKQAEQKLLHWLATQNSTSAVEECVDDMKKSLEKGKYAKEESFGGPEYLEKVKETFFKAVERNIQRYAGIEPDPTRKQRNPHSLDQYHTFRDNFDEIEEVTSQLTKDEFMQVEREFGGFRGIAHNAAGFLDALKRKRDERNNNNPTTANQNLNSENRSSASSSNADNNTPTTVGRSTEPKEDRTRNEGGAEVGTQRDQPTNTAASSASSGKGQSTLPASSQNSNNADEEIHLLKPSIRARIENLGPNQSLTVGEKVYRKDKDGNIYSRSRSDTAKRTTSEISLESRGTVEGNLISSDQQPRSRDGYTVPKNPNPYKSSRNDTDNQGSSNSQSQHKQKDKPSSQVYSGDNISQVAAHFNRLSLSGMEYIRALNPGQTFTSKDGATYKKSKDGRYVEFTPPGGNKEMFVLPPELNSNVNRKSRYYAPAPSNSYQENHHTAYSRGHESYSRSYEETPDRRNETRDNNSYFQDSSASSEYQPRTYENMNNPQENTYREAEDAWNNRDIFSNPSDDTTSKSSYWGYENPTPTLTFDSNTSYSNEDTSYNSGYEDRTLALNSSNTSYSNEVENYNSGYGDTTYNRGYADMTPVPTSDLRELVAFGTDTSPYRSDYVEVVEYEGINIVNFTNHDEGGSTNYRLNPNNSWTTTYENGKGRG